MKTIKSHDLATLVTDPINDGHIRISISSHSKDVCLLNNRAPHLNMDTLNGLYEFVSIDSAVKIINKGKTAQVDFTNDKTKTFNDILDIMLTLVTALPLEVENVVIFTEDIDWSQLDHSGLRRVVTEAFLSGELDIWSKYLLTDMKHEDTTLPIASVVPEDYIEELVKTHGEVKHIGNTFYLGVDWREGNAILLMAVKGQNREDLKNSIAYTTEFTVNQHPKLAVVKRKRYVIIDTDFGILLDFSK